MNTLYILDLHTLSRFDGESVTPVEIELKTRVSAGNLFEFTQKCNHRCLTYIPSAYPHRLCIRTLRGQLEGSLRHPSCLAVRITVVQR
jgi:hypothetical protein